MKYVERHYRNRVKVKDLTTFHVSVKETDLWVSAEQELVKETEGIVHDLRFSLEGYIEMHPVFFTTLTPYPDDPYAPQIIREMIACSMSAGVGPMASVAGAIAQHVAYGLKDLSQQVIIENGGDIYMNLLRDVTVSIYAGTSPLSDRIGIKIPERMMPVGVCSSSGRIGHSLSMGNSDVVCVIAKSAPLADAAATALANMVKTKKELKRLSESAGQIEGVLGLVAIMDDEMTAWGDVELAAL
ncbi:MAG: UPF0280 family protein [Desulfatiglans sp.]|jgi:ApbE superfamily uncharacterized protein (UPF0280 family)|nr:UPF0280 family protein [Desulfatiglans sp.]